MMLAYMVAYGLLAALFAGAIFISIVAAIPNKQSSRLAGGDGGGGGGGSSILEEELVPSTPSDLWTSSPLGQQRFRLQVKVLVCLFALRCAFHVFFISSYYGASMDDDSDGASCAASWGRDPSHDQPAERQLRCLARLTRPIVPHAARAQVRCRRLCRQPGRHLSAAADCPRPDGRRSGLRDLPALGLPTRARRAADGGAARLLAAAGREAFARRRAGRGVRRRRCCRRPQLQRQHPWSAPDHV